MKIALVTGPSGSGKSFVADQLRGSFECVSYDRLMRNSIERTFPNHVGDEWDKQIWLDNSQRLDLVAAFAPAFTWSGTRPLVVEGWQLREKLWRNAILDLAAARAEVAVLPRLFVIQPTLELLLSLPRSQPTRISSKARDRRRLRAADCDPLENGP